MCMNLVPTLRPCSSECVIHRIALSADLAEWSSDPINLSTKREDVASSADVGSESTSNDLVTGVEQIV
jgi:hypothetical protein